jgi:hypothetical protein
MFEDYAQAIADLAISRLSLAEGKSRSFGLHDRMSQSAAQQMRYIKTVDKYAKINGTPRINTKVVL